MALLLDKSYVLNGSLAYKQYKSQDTLYATVSGISYKTLLHNK